MRLVVLALPSENRATPGGDGGADAAMLVDRINAFAVCGIARFETPPMDIGRCAEYF